MFCGWGNNGFGNRGFGQGEGGGGVTYVGSPAFQGALTRGDLCMDMNFSDLESGVRGVSDGICQLGYDQLAQMNGINSNIAALNSNLNNAVCTLGYNTQQGFNDVNLALLNSQNAQTIAAMQNQNALQTQIAECCCNAREQVADVKYQMAADTCAINNTANTNTRDIIESNCANTRAILEAIQQGKIDAMQDRIASLQAENTRLAFQASQDAQNSYLVNQLRPCPIPSYITCNPWATQVSYGACGCA